MRKHSNSFILAAAVAALLAGPQASASAMDAPGSPPMGPPPATQPGQGIDPYAAAWLETIDINQLNLAGDPDGILLNDGWAPVDNLTALAAANADAVAELPDDSQVIDPTDPIEQILAVLGDSYNGQAQNAGNGQFNVGLQALAGVGTVPGAPLGLIPVTLPLDPGGQWDFEAGPWHWLDVALTDQTKAGLVGDMKKAGLIYRVKKQVARKIQVQGQNVERKLRPLRMYLRNAEQKLWYALQVLPPGHKKIQYIQNNIVKWKNKIAPLEASRLALMAAWMQAQWNQAMWLENFNEAQGKARDKGWVPPFWIQLGPNANQPQGNG